MTCDVVLCLDSPGVCGPERGSLHQVAEILLILREFRHVAMPVRAPSGSRPRRFSAAFLTCINPVAADFVAILFRQLSFRALFGLNASRQFLEMGTGHER